MNPPVRQTAGNTRREVVGDVEEGPLPRIPGQAAGPDLRISKARKRKNRRMTDGHSHGMPVAAGSIAATSSMITQGGSLTPSASIPARAPGRPEAG
jgi:hypothetical protein